MSAPWSLYVTSHCHGMNPQRRRSARRGFWEQNWMHRLKDVSEQRITKYRNRSQRYMCIYIYIYIYIWCGQCKKTGRVLQKIGTGALVWSGKIRKRTPIPCFAVRLSRQELWTLHPIYIVSADHSLSCAFVWQFMTAELSDTLTKKKSYSQLPDTKWNFAVFCHRWCANSTFVSFRIVLFTSNM